MYLSPFSCFSCPADNESVASPRHVSLFLTLEAALLELACMKLDHSLSCGGKMRIARRTLSRVTVIAAATVTVLFGLSTIFAFGAATHRRARLSWHSSSANADLVQ